MGPVTGRFSIEDITPVVDCGRYAAKAVVGEHVPITAVSYREGHDALGVMAVWRGPDGERLPVRMAALGGGTDRWLGAIVPDAVGAWQFAIEAFSDPYLTWHHAVIKKVEAGQGVEDLANDLAKGASILDLAVKGAPDSVVEELTRTPPSPTGSSPRWRWNRSSGTTRSGSWSPFPGGRSCGSTVPGHCSPRGMRCFRARKRHPSPWPYPRRSANR
jgi:starch synthase (maltosyl-transferring)